MSIGAMHARLMDRFGRKMTFRRPRRSGGYEVEAEVQGYQKRSTDIDMAGGAAVQMDRVMLVISAAALKAKGLARVSAPDQFVIDGAIRTVIGEARPLYDGENLVGFDVTCTG